MDHRINSAMDSEVAKSTDKYLRIATSASTGGGKAYEDFIATVETQGARLENAIAEALGLYTDLHPVQ